MSRNNRKKVTSQAKAESNRKNATKSTGPKTKRGKQIVKWNAMKHGLLSKEVVIETGDGQEDPKEFELLYKCLIDQLKPVGIIEDMLVEKIAVCYWRKRRLIKFESGEILKKQQLTSWELAEQQLKKISFYKSTIIFDEGRLEMLSLSLGVQYLKRILENIRDEIDAMGYLTENTRDELLKNFGKEQGSIAFQLLLVDHMVKEGPRLCKENPEEFGEPISPEKAKKIMLKFIDDEYQKLEAMEEILVKKEEMESEAEVQSRSLPGKETIDKIIRYETALEKQFYRALHELIRLQSARTGGNPSLPVSIDVTLAN